MVTLQLWLNWASVVVFTVLAFLCLGCAWQNVRSLRAARVVGATTLRMVLIQFATLWVLGAIVCVHLASHALAKLGL